MEITNPYSIRLGVAGAGVMGSGIALTALQQGMNVTLYDVAEGVLEKARAYIEKFLTKKNQGGYLRRLTLTTRLEDLRGASVVIEAAPEDLDIKKDLFRRLDALCPPPAVLATNTSTLAVTAIAAAISSPERVAGMHFFNPAPVMPLVEVVRGARSSPETVNTLVSLAEFLGKTPIVVRDLPGFIVNRVARPFYGEALRLLGEGAATHEAIDLIIRQGGGFRMGPFQLMDLIGVDVNFAAMQSMYTQTFGEPRYRPHPIQAQMVQQQALGRKSGRGFYDYTNGAEITDPPPLRPSKAEGQVIISSGTWAPGLEALCRQSAYSLRTMTGMDLITVGRPTAAVLAAGRGEGLARLAADLDQLLPPEIPLLCQCTDVTLTEVGSWLRHPQRLAGFDGLFAAAGNVVTLVSLPHTREAVRSQVESFFASLGKRAVWVEDSPALVLPRVVCMLANEAAFAAGEGVADMGTIDTAMRLGVNYPRGPLEWAQSLGYAKTAAVLDHLHSEYREERYRAAPLLRRLARLESYPPES